MIVKALVKIIYNSKEYNKEDEFEVNETTGNNLLKRKCVEKIKDTDDKYRKELMKMTVSELKEEAEKIGLELTGTKKEEIIREIIDNTEEE